MQRWALVFRDERWQVWIWFGAEISDGQLKRRLHSRVSIRILLVVLRYDCCSVDEVSACLQAKEPFPDSCWPLINQFHINSAGKKAKIQTKMVWTNKTNVVWSCTQHVLKFDQKVAWSEHFRFTIRARRRFHRLAGALLSNENAIQLNEHSEMPGQGFLCKLEYTYEA